MRIKKLELLGFKSFKDRTVISFDHGITGIVGPNGCGKSNIVDALVWVMGEMSAKQLRGSSMEDVIFAGSEDYAPVGLAEVSLTLENDGGPFPIKYLNHSEVMVTRRLHRNGETEYLVNKEPVRLKDIQEIFMDTGAGSKGFSIVEQGQIGRIITSKPSERRTLIEEAAGITKFKARKRETVRKLASTDQNLVRLADIVRELKRQLDSLERQAQRAERYRKLKTELREKELWVSALEIKAGKVNFDELEVNLSELSEREAFLSAEIEKLQAEIELEKGKNLEKEKALESKQQEFKTLSQDVLEFENQVRSLEFEIEQTRRSQEIKGSVYEQSKARLDALQSEKNEVQENFTRVKNSFDAIKEEFESLDEKYQNHQREFDEKEIALSESRKSMLELHQGVSHLQAQIAGLKEKVESVSGEIESRNTVRAELKETFESFEKRYVQLSKGYEQEKQLKLEIVKDRETILDNLNQVKASIEELEVEKEEKLSVYNTSKSRHESLVELQNRYEGYQEGIRNLLLHEGGRLSEKSGKLLSDLVQVPEDFVQAVDNCLGDSLQALFGVDSFEQLSDSMNYLVQEKAGRVQFFVNELIHHEAGQAKGEYPSLDQFLVPGASENLKKILSSFYLVPDFETGKDFLKSCHGFCITQRGEMLSSLGQFYTGLSGNEDSGLMSRKNLIESLQQEVQQSKLSLDALTKELSKAKARAQQLSEELDQASQKDSEQELKVFELKKDLEQSEYEKKKAQKELDKVEQALKELEEKLTLNQNKHDEFVESLRDLESQRTQKEQSSEQLERNLEELKSSAGDLQERVTASKVEFASQSKELEALEKRLEQLNQNEGQIKGELGDLENESEESSSNISNYFSELETKKVELESKIQKRNELETLVASMRDDYEQWSAREREVQQEVTKHTLDKSKVDSEIGDCRVQSEQLRLQLQSVVDQIFERYEIDLSEKHEDYSDSFSENEKDGILGDISSLKNKVQKMGEVNLSAINEYDDITKRYEFLSKQQQDLLNAKDQLEKVINRINRICSQRFRETYEAVNERFKKVFPVLFGGGEARLILVETEDDKDPGIDIEAKPPGKKAQNVSLLSGGEKALTSVSLIFSIFLVKPSPYCLLDEVDAPLDDANVFRFNDLIKEMAKRSQIILVTHNKNTMAVNNKLYGVTQEEKGVSKMVSVDLDGNFLKEVSGTA